jgi:hypothetical protein
MRNVPATTQQVMTKKTSAAKATRLATLRKVRVDAIKRGIYQTDMCS